MKLMIASDLHGSSYWCARMLEAYKTDEQPDRLIFLGDILYHGPRNDLPKEYAPKEVIALLNPPRRSSSASAATATARSTRWCCRFPCWRTTAF